MGIGAALRGLLNTETPVRAIERREPMLNAKSIGGGGGFLGMGYGGWGMMPGSTGIPVSPYSALQVATAWACVKRLAEDNGKLPRQVRRRLSTGGYRVDPQHPLNRLLRKPNDWQTPSQCWNFMAAWLALRGNAYAVVKRGPAGEPMSLVPVVPDQVSVLRSSNGLLYYQVNHPTLPPGRYHRDNIIHLRGAISVDGFTGISPIAAAQDVFGLGIATQQHGATLFRQGAQLKGYIKHPKTLSPEGKTYLTNEFDRENAGVQKAHRTTVLDEGMDFVSLSMSNDDAQFLQSRQFTVPEVCRMFGVPPHKVHDLSNAHFSNIEQSELAYRSDTLLPITNQMREEFGRVLLFEDEQGDYEIDVDYDELLKTDRKTRYETDAIGINSGRLSRNEARIDDGREPNVPGGDEFLQRLDTTTTTQAGGEAPAAPPAPAAQP